jgi:hypothetical protein
MPSCRAPQADGLNELPSSSTWLRSCEPQRVRWKTDRQHAYVASGLGQVACFAAADRWPARKVCSCMQVYGHPESNSSAALRIGDWRLAAAAETGGSPVRPPSTGGFSFDQPSVNIDDVYSPLSQASISVGRVPAIAAAEATPQTLSPLRPRALHASAALLATVERDATLCAHGRGHDQGEHVTLHALLPCTPEERRIRPCGSAVLFDVCRLPCPQTHPS